MKPHQMENRKMEMDGNQTTSTVFLKTQDLRKSFNYNMENAHHPQPQGLTTSETE